MTTATPLHDILNAFTAPAREIERVALVEAALSSGIVEQVNSTQNITELAGTLGMPVPLAVAVCDALTNEGVLVATGHSYRLSPEFSRVHDAGAVDSVLNRLRLSTVRAHLLRDIVRGGDGGPSYWNVSTDAQLILARGATFDPYSPVARDACSASIRAIPEWHAALTAGGRFLDFGCGASGMILSLLQLYPAARAVGIDRSAALIHYSREQAARLGIADRAEFVVTEAADYVADQRCDAAFWPQTFYQTEARATALRSLLANVNAGAVIATNQGYLSPALQTPPTIDIALAVSWGVPILSVEQVADELIAAGFIDTAARAMPPPVQPMITARRPPW